MTTVATVRLFSALAILAAASCSNHMDMGNHSIDARDISTTPLASAVTYDAVYVVNGGDHSVSVIDASTNAVTGAITLNNVLYPHHIYLSPDGTRLAIGVPGMDFSAGHHGSIAGMTGAVIVLAAQTGDLVAARTIMSMNHNAAFDPTGSEIWTCGMLSAGLAYILDATSLELSDSIAVGATPQEVTFTPGGRYAFVCNGGSNSVTVIDRSARSVVTTIDVGRNPVGAWPGDNGVMYVDNEESMTISAIDTTTLTVHHTYDLGFTPGMVATGPGDELWITNSDSGAVAINRATEDLSMGHIATGAGAHGIAFNADKSRAYITNQLAASVSVIDVATKSVIATVSVGRKPNGLVWRRHSL